jgi:hypothetical protein
MRALLDVNAPIALLDEEHVHHEAQLARMTSKGHQYLGMPAHPRPPARFAGGM